MTATLMFNYWKAAEKFSCKEREKGNGFHIQVQKLVLFQYI